MDTTEFGFLAGAGVLLASWIMGLPNHSFSAWALGVMTLPVVHILSNLAARAFRKVRRASVHRRTLRQLRQEANQS